MSVDIFPEKYDTVPSDRLGVSRLVATVVLVSSGNGHIAEAAGVVTYAKLGRTNLKTEEEPHVLQGVVTRSES